MMNSKSVATLPSAITLVLLSGLLSAQPPTALSPVQERIQGLQQASIQNEEKLHAYQWIESATVTVNGNPKPPKQSLCRYTPEGTLAKTPIARSNKRHNLRVVR